MCYFPSEVQVISTEIGKGERVVPNCGREIKLNKCLAEVEDNTIAFSKVGSVHTNGYDGTCRSSGSMALPCSDRHLLFALDIAFCGQTLNLSGKNKFQISFFCLTKVANGQHEEIGMLVWGVRNGVCEYVDLGKGGLSTPNAMRKM